MKKIDLGQTISILANVGVIAGIAFLAVELRQNNELMASQARFNRLSVTTGSADLLIENTDLSETYLRALGGEVLAPSEQFQLENFFFRVVSNVEWSFGELPEASYPMGRWRFIFQAVPLRNYWQGNRAQFSSEFAAFIDENFFNP